jgi:hypothetical protein
MRKKLQYSFFGLRTAIRVQGSFFLLACASPLIAQAGIGIAGGHATSEDISISYSVGQVFNNAFSHPDYYVSQGIQHPMLLWINQTPVQEMETAGIRIYPNPVANALHIERQSTDLQRCRVLLINMQGQVLIDKTFDAAEIVLPIESIAVGSYLLKINIGKLETYTYTILKAK